MPRHIVPSVWKGSPVANRPPSDSQVCMREIQENQLTSAITAQDATERPQNKPRLAEGDNAP
jgi:hypothetical protein